MLKIDLTRKEYDELTNKLMLNEFQERILEYRIKEYSITKMSILEHCSESTINREIKKIKNKIKKVIWLIFFFYGKNMTIIWNL